MEETSADTLSCRLETPDEPTLTTITKALNYEGVEASAIHKLLVDPEENLKLLDLPEFQDAVLTHDTWIQQSLVLYVKVRRKLLQAGLNNPKTAIYLSRVWLNYRKNGILPEINNHERDMVQTVDILGELAQVIGYEKFELLAMSGNYYLFLMAFFEDYFHELEANMQKLSPSYYEAFARISYRAASDHDLSSEFELQEVCSDLAENFTKIRIALSELRPEAQLQPTES